MADADGASLVERFLAALPMWLFMSGGLALVAMAVWTPQWQANRHLTWEKQVMEAQSQTLARQRQRYEQFLAALERDDPVLLRRLAFAQLRRKPVETEVLDLVPVDDASAGQLSDPAVSAAVETWLNLPPPRVGKDLAPFVATNTRLTRLATGENRTYLLLAGVVCLAGGLVPGRSRRRA